MGQYQKAYTLNASVDDCYRNLMVVFRKLDITVKSQDDGALEVRGCWGKKTTGIFFVEAVCIPTGEKTAELKLLYDISWTPAWQRATRAIGVEKPPEVSAMFDNIYLGMSNALGVEDREIDRSKLACQVNQPGPLTLEDLKKGLRSWGLGMMVIGAVSLFLPQQLDPVWGIGLLVLGVINLLVVHRAMLVVNGIALMIAGAINIIGVLSSEFSYFFIFGCLQIVWGIEEILKFKKYQHVGKASGNDAQA